MTPLRFGPLELAACSDCGGAWITAPDLVTLFRAGRRRVTRLAATLQRAPAQPRSSSLCPHCEGELREAQLPSVPGVWMETCGPCKSFWVTGSQLAQAAERLPEEPMLPHDPRTSLPGGRPAPGPAPTAPRPSTAAPAPVLPVAPAPSARLDAQGFRDYLSQMAAAAPQSPTGWVPAGAPWKPAADPSEVELISMDARLAGRETWKHGESAAAATQKACCAGCGRETDPEMPACSHCGRLQPGNPAGSCPACEKGRRAYRSDGIEVTCCDNCGGIWMERGRLSALLRQEPQQRDRRVAGLQKRRYRATPPPELCTACGLLLFVRRAVHDDSVKMAACPSCEGTFLKLDDLALALQAAG